MRSTHARGYALVALAFAAIVTSARPVHAYCINTATIWSSNATKVLGASTTFPTAMRPALSDSLANWNMVNSALVYAAPTYTSAWASYPFKAEMVNFSVVGLSNTLPAYAQDSNITPAHSTGFLRFNSNFSWTNGTQSIPGMVADTATIAVHEIGHFNGMSHPTECYPTPVPAAEAASVMTVSNFAIKRSLAATDVNYQQTFY